MIIILYNLSKSQIDCVKTAIERIKDAKEALCKATDIPDNKPANDRVSHILSLLIDAENFALPLTAD